MKIGIVGNGVVGSATAAAYRWRHDVRCFDTVDRLRTHTLHQATVECDLIFICLPTPMKEDGRCDLSAIDEFFRFMVYELAQYDLPYVLRSTVPIGTTRDIASRMNLTNLVHCPEFLTARTAKQDAENPTRVLIGYTTDNLGERLYSFFRNEHGPDLYIFVMPSDETEAVKLFQNSFSAVKIAFFNEIHSLCQRSKLDWQRILRALLEGGWISPMHTKVPGPDGQFGFGGACLPKDLSNLIHCLDDAGLTSTITSAARFRNEWDRHQ